MINFLISFVNYLIPSLFIIILYGPGLFSYIITSLLTLEFLLLCFFAIRRKKKKIYEKKHSLFAFAALSISGLPATLFIMLLPGFEFISAMRLVLSVLYLSGFVRSRIYFFVSFYVSGLILFYISGNAVLTLEKVGSHILPIISGLFIRCKRVNVYNSDRKYKIVEKKTG